MSSIKIFNSIQDFISYRDSLDKNIQIGFVPTMGALHQGHAHLIRQAAHENNLCILSIFVNPTQFNNQEDLKKYPRTWEDDLKTAEANGANVVLSPYFEEIYPDNYSYKINENTFSKVLCGAHRPGHFDGVLSVVLKLLNIVRPKHAYFGEKDFQQLQLIKDMVAAFFLRTQIVPCKTIREADGLAMSSRNVRLTPEGRVKAPQIFKTVTKYHDFEEAKKYLQTYNIELEYLEEHFGRRFIAAYLEGVRLIDNVEIA